MTARAGGVERAARRAMWAGVAVVAWCSAGSGGCRSAPRDRGPVTIPNELGGPITIAVAPALNQSGSNAFDPNRFADLMASELGYARSVRVVPVSRTLALLGAEGREQVESPEHAFSLAEALGADALLVFAVTEYDPYEPPVIGITAQLYGRLPSEERKGIDPVSLSRKARGTAENTPRAGPRLLAQHQRVFDASHDAVIMELQRFAENRGAGDSPYGWRRYVVRQQDYIRFVCHATLERLLAGPGGSASAKAAPPEGMP